jgi:plastocyanin
VKRLRHWWTCQPAASAPLSQPALPLSAAEAPAGAAPSQPEPEVGHLGVKAVEWSYTLSRPEVSAGEVIVELNNQGEDAHNLVLERQASADPPLKVSPALPASQTSARLTLAAGTYRLYCSLDDHAAKGMEATLVVGD